MGKNSQQKISKQPEFKGIGIAFLFINMVHLLRCYKPIIRHIFIHKALQSLCE